VTVAQLVRAGLTTSAIAKRVRAGRLHHVHRGVYAVGHPRLSRQGRWMAAVLAGGSGTVLAGPSAAELWNMTRSRSGVSHVLVPRERGPQPGIRFRSCRRLDPRDWIIRYGIPVTTVARTQVDLSDTMTADRLTNVIHEADWRNRFNEQATRAAMARANGRHRLAILDTALELHASGSAGTRSDPEDAFLALIEPTDLPTPLVNVKADGLEVDFRWPRLCVEVDGHGHTRPRTMREDRRRDAGLKANGFTILRFTANQVEEQPAYVLAEVQAAANLSPSLPAAVRQKRGSKNS
jgi:hypothetical protein